MSTKTAKNNFSTRCERNYLYVPSVPLGMRKSKQDVRWMAATWLEAQSQDKLMFVMEIQIRVIRKKKNIKMGRA